MVTPNKPKTKRPRTNAIAEAGNGPAPAQVVEPAPAPIAPEVPDKPFPVVGIVASAGGLEAFKHFFQAMPSESGIAFILVPHLDPRQQSLMAELLGKYTDMPVHEAGDGELIQPNAVYVIPPNKYLRVESGVLKLAGPMDRKGPPTAMDAFLRSLADDMQERAICIVLSGTGSHGTLGLKAVKAAGGMAMVQDPQDADYDQMPHNAIASGLADYVLPASDMPQVLVEYAKHYVAQNGGQPEEALPAEDITPVLTLMRVRSKVDFRAYRPRMLLRRIQRRMGLCHVDTLQAYVKMLREQPEELEQLSKDLLISVTHFFRDAAMYQVLEGQVMPELVRSKPSGSAIRIWVPGCATGEEAYSIAMVVLEQLAAQEKVCPVQIFATDVDVDALDVARRGVYTDSILTDVSPDRIARFFDKADDHNYQVGKQLREAVLFAEQNILFDAPFSRLDLVTCRNLLIYLEHEVQQKVIGLLHFALNVGGYLVLGPSETVGRHGDAFEAVSKKWRIYRRIGTQTHPRIDFPIAGGRGPNTASVPLLTGPLTPADLARNALLDSYAPASVVINRNFDVLHYHGNTGLYMQQPPGAPTHELTALAAPGLRAGIRASVHKAMREDDVANVGDGHVQRNGRYVPVRITARPLRSARGGTGLLMVSFEDQPEPNVASEADEKTRHDETVARQLEYEIKTVREELQSTIEELERSNEELKASNEEVMSMNEELQSANEELETSKEELQSLNEELTTVNSQLQEKVDETEAANNDMANLLISTDIATVFLDTTLRIKRFTPAATRLFNLIAGDIGRPIGDITARFADPDLSTDVATVLETLTPREKEVETGDGRWFMRRVTPYRTLDNHIEGVVVAVNEVTALKLAAQAQRELAKLLEQRVTERTAERDVEMEGRQRAESEAALRQTELAHAHRLNTAGELTAAIAHELNQPLTAIATFAESSLRRMKRGHLDAEAEARTMEQIGQQAQRAASVIRELRAFLSKSDTALGKADINVLIRAARDMVAAEAASRKVRIELAMAEGLPEVGARDIQIEQVLLNLLRNAIEAITAAEVADGRIVVSSQLNGDGAVQVTVQDNGPGPAADNVGRVFDAFYTTKPQGLGIGLRISRSIIESHGGKIWLEPGAGGTFHFTLPVAP